MAPWQSCAPPRRLAIAILAVGFTCASSAHALRIVNYNITNYPNLNGSGRDPHFRTILSPLQADIVVVQEMQSQAGVDQFRNLVLNTLEPDEWASAPFTNGNDTDNALFYKPAKVQFLGQWAFYPNPADRLRFVNCYRIKPVGYSGAAAELRLYSQHLKASQGSSNEARRLGEAIGIRDSMNAMPPGTHAILLGDFNIYTSSEPAFQKFLEVQGDNDGRLYDPLNAPGDWHANPAFAAIHTQCPCVSCPSGFAGGGLDDRFDMFLPTRNMGDGEGLDLVPGTYVPVGNDGSHFDKNITDAPTIPEGAGYATALWSASDHLPVRVDVQLPARIAVVASFDLGMVIVGGAAELEISNVAESPADDLDYSLAAPSGFTAPGGAFQLDSGAAVLHAIGTAPGSPGARSGDLIILSDDPDTPGRLVQLSADVLDHAQASLDSLNPVLTTTLDFGTHPAGGFPTLLARVHNRGYHPLQARLALQSGDDAGGAGRFSIVGGFSPGLVSSTARSFEVKFDDAGATPDSTYEATLTFQSEDEGLPGALPQPDLVVTLHARVQGHPVATPADRAPGLTRLHPPYPNPLRGDGTVRFDLAQPGRARLEIFDLAGRSVAVLANRFFEAGRHSLSWNGREATGARLDPGLYFVRLDGLGLRAQNARVVVVR